MKSDEQQLKNPKETVNPNPDWRDKYTKKHGGGPLDLENTAEDSTLNRMIQLRDFDQTKAIQGKPGALYFDKANKKVKIFISESDGWKDITYS